MTESWWEYLMRVTSHASRSEVANAAGVDPASVSRWKTGRNTPSADRVIAVARHYGRNPIEALVAAGYLDPTEVDATVEVAEGTAGLTNEQLLDALRDRLIAAESAVGSTGDDAPPVRWEAARTAESDGSADSDGRPSA